MNERWRPVLGFSNYEVSDLGKVRRLSYRAECGNGGRTRLIRGRRERPEVTWEGRLRVKLRNGTGKIFRKAISTLVLEAFVGPRPRGMECCHFPDRSPKNNRLRNLRWDTPAANVADAVKHGTRPGRAAPARSPGRAPGAPCGA